MLPHKQIAPDTYRFSPDTWTVELTGKPHKASYRRELSNNQQARYSGDRRYVLNKGNILIFGEGMIYTDHIWRVCKNLDHYQLATLTIDTDGIRITQDNVCVFLKWQTSPRMLELAKAF